MEKEKSDQALFRASKQQHDFRQEDPESLQFDVEQTHSNQKENMEKYKTLKWILHSIPYQIFITIITISSLFADDIRIVAFDQHADIGFDILSMVMIIIFTIEIIVSWIAFQQYRWSFFFVLDLVSTFSLILDIGLLTDLLYSNTSNTYGFSKIASQSKASRVATRAVRIVKLFRIIRVVKLYKSAVRASQIKQQIKQQRLNKNKAKQKKIQAMSAQKQEQNSSFPLETNQKQKKILDMINANQENKDQISQQQVKEKKENDQKKSKNSMMKKRQSVQIDDNYLSSQFINEMEGKQSKISKVLSDITLKKVIIMVLLLMFLVPLFDTENYIQDPNDWDFITIDIQRMLNMPSIFPIDTINNYITNRISSYNSDNEFIVYFNTPFNQLPSFSHGKYVNERIQDLNASTDEIDVDKILALRNGLTRKNNLIDQEKFSIYAVVDIQAYNRIQGYFSIGKTIFVCIILIGLLHFFSKDIDQLIVEPIQLMMNHVMEIARNPQSSLTTTVDQTQYQTAIVHNAIVKIGALLSLVFGSAGVQIIGSNLMKEGDVNPLIGGKKKCAIFGFCDIRNFTQITEILEEDIMIFVNTISQLVHSAVYRYGGGANKNIGQAFLLVWKIPDQNYAINSATNEITWKDKEHLNILADFSILSFIKTIVKINKDPEILAYRKDPRLIKKFGEGFQVSMGFGLHIGWAIEGAIGSQYKIDASYLSPNVNMASRLQAATRQFGVDLLVSQDLYNVCTKQMQTYLRNIDRVTVKGSNKPIRFYTVDLNLNNISPPSNKQEKYPNPDDRPDVQLKKQINLEYMNPDSNHHYDAHTFIKGKKQLREVMIGSTNQNFKNSFQLGLKAYLKGIWPDAKMHFTQAQKYNNSDGPTKTLLKYMKKHNFVAPQTWKNYRQLTQK